MTEQTVDITVDGETVSIEVEELSALDVMRWAAKAPDSLQSGDPDDVVAGPDVVEFMVDLTTEQTVLTEELLDELEHEQLGRVLGQVVAYSFGQEPETDSIKSRTIDFDDDDSLDLGDWE